MAAHMLVLSMVGARTILPIGPFCPIHSNACRPSGALDVDMSRLGARGSKIAAEMARIQLSAQMGQMPDVSRFRGLADDLDDALSVWQRSMRQLTETDDFQSREFAAVTDSHITRAGVSMSDMCAALAWQVEFLRAMADGKPPPTPPDVDLSNLGDGGFDLARSISPPTVDAPPFVDGATGAFASELVRAEYQTLVAEHAALITMGARFGTFDPRGQLAFIDAIEAVEERWDVLFSRFALMQQINPDFVAQTDAYLEAMGLDGPDDMRGLITLAHERMRASARTQL
jgi:hypothetical protein